MSILKETWTGEREIPANFGKSAADYLTEFRDHMEVAHGYADEQSNISQQRYVNRYNVRSRDKTFVKGDKCLILHPDSTTSKVFSRWLGPADIIEVSSKNSYLVELDQKRYKMHANYLRKFYVRVYEVVCHSIILMSPELRNDVFVKCNTAIITCSAVALSRVLSTALVPFGNKETSTPHSSETSQVITMKLCTYDNVRKINTSAKFG